MYVGKYVHLFPHRMLLLYYYLFIIFQLERNFEFQAGK